LANKHPSYIKNTYEFISKIKNREIPPEALLVTADITSLYTNMRKDLIIKAVIKQMVLNPVENRPDIEILKLLEYTMDHNDFEFNNEFFLQIFGLAMGKTYSPNIANIYLIDFDEQAMHDFKINPKFYHRFQDDTFFVWIGSLEDLLQYETFLNSLIPDIKLTFNYSYSKVNFLDVTIYKKWTDEKCLLQHRTYFKETDTHQLLYYYSHHPKHIFRGIIKSQFIRFKRLSSSLEDYNVTCNFVLPILYKRGYPKRLMRKLKIETWNSPIIPRNIMNVKNSLFITLPYNKTSQSIMELWKCLVEKHPQFKNTKIVKAFYNNKNLYKYLIRNN